MHPGEWQDPRDFARMGNAARALIEFLDDAREMAAEVAEWRESPSELLERLNRIKATLKVASTALDHLLFLTRKNLPRRGRPKS